MHSDAAAAPAPAPSHDTHVVHDTSFHQHHSIDHNHYHQHDHSHDHHRHHHHHHHHHRHQPDGSDEPPVEALTTPLLWQQRRQRPPPADDGNAPGAGTRMLQFVFGFVAVGFFIFGFISWIQAAHRAGIDPWSSSVPVMKPKEIFENNHRNTEDRVRDILASTPLIDGHNDLAIFILEFYQNNLTNHDFRDRFKNGSLPQNVDLARLRSGRSGGAFWSAFVPCPLNASSDMSDANYAQFTALTLEQIDLLRRLQAQYPQDFTPALSTPLDVSGRENMLLQWHATRSLFGPISIEGLHQVPPSSPLSSLRLYHALGVRMATLTWNCHNPFADASLLYNGYSNPPTVVNGVFRPKEGAITFRGRQVLQEMNRLGIIVDISHTSYWTQKAVLSPDESGGRLVRAPVVFSHSSAYSLCPHPRNVRDDILDLVRKTNSLVMVNFSPGFISCTAPTETPDIQDPHFTLPDSYEKNNTLHRVARHITYIANRIGYDHVGIGSDFDGMGTEHPRGLDGVDKFPDLVAELLEMGVTDQDARKVVGGNLLRVWKDVDDVATQMASEGVEAGVDNAGDWI